MANKAKKLSQENGKAFLRQALVGVEETFLQKLKQNKKSITHDPTMGDATEDSWIELLEQYLPKRYRVAKAFAIDHLGNTTEQLDCLIYDSHFTPVLFGKDKHQYVPAEAVYATFEIKQEVSAQHLAAAAQKLASLRRLNRTSAPIPWTKGKNPPKKPFQIIGGLLSLNASWRDKLGVAFKKQFDSYLGDEKLNFVLTAEDGFYDHFDTKKKASLVTGEGSLIVGLFRLLTALRDCSTVGAVNWEDYEKALRGE